MEVWVEEREGPVQVALDLTVGGTFARSTEGSYYVGAPTDGSSPFLAWASAGTRRIENRGDGLGLSYLTERSSTNYALQNRAIDNAAWSHFSGTSTVTADQNGGADATGVADRQSVTSGNYGMTQSTCGPAGRVCYSQWVRAVSGTCVAQCESSHSNYGLAGTAAYLTATTTYQRLLGASYTATTNSGYTTMDGRDLASLGVSGGYNAAHAEDTYSDLHQLENGYYVTSAIRTTSASVTRSADALSYASGSYPVGFLTSGVVIVLAPDASSADIVAANEDWRLVQVGSSDYVRIRNVSGACKVELVCGGSVVAALTVTFGRAQALTITARPSAGSLTVSGATTGNGTATGSGAAWASASTLYVGTDSAGTNPVTGRYVGAAITQAS